MFISIDASPDKKFIVDMLQTFGIPFVDVGVGLYQVGDALGGIVRTTASAAGQTNHIRDYDRISFADVDDDEYDQNIQIAELNMLNAALE